MEFTAEKVRAMMPVDEPLGADIVRRRIERAAQAGHDIAGFDKGELSEGMRAGLAMAGFTLERGFSGGFFVRW